jgi:hypothetical protein
MQIGNKKAAGGLYGFIVDFDLSLACESPAVEGEKLKKNLGMGVISFF